MAMAQRLRERLALARGRGEEVEEVEEGSAERAAHGGEALADEVAAFAFDPDAELEGIEPLVPVSERAAKIAAAVRRATPRAFRERMPSLEERMQYSLTGDWTLSKSPALRTMHLVFTVLIGFPIGLIGASMMWASEKPTRLPIPIVYIVLLIAALGGCAS